MSGARGVHDGAWLVCRVCRVPREAVSPYMEILEVAAGNRVMQMQSKGWRPLLQNRFIRNG